MEKTSTDAEVSKNFIEKIIEKDLENNVISNGIVTRFPPEPNGYLHIGHAKAISINFSVAKKYEGVCHLRFDDTNPAKEELAYMEAIKKDISWLGFKWEPHEYFASDYFSAIYDIAVELIKQGKAYVDTLTPEQVREYRGTLTQPGKNSPDRDRPIEENLELFEEMRNGQHADGTMVLRAKIDMSSPNLNMRDPTLFRIKKIDHHRTGDTWSIYPMYDFTHPISDAIEGITHSLCSLEFEDHRPLYDWVVENSGLQATPHQYEFARLNLTYTVMSKRLLLQLVKEEHVSGWDDPRMPTLSAMRRRGFSPEAILDFTEKIGVARANSLVDYALLEHCVREDLNTTALRIMAVLDPLKVIIDNYPQDSEEWFEAENNPENPAAGTRKIPFSKVIYIEKDDFMENPPKKYFRLSPGKEIRLKHAYYITCTGIIKDGDQITEIHCNYDPESRGGSTPDGRKVKGTSHWVSASHSIDCEVRLYDRLFTAEIPGSRTGNFLDDINHNSIKVLKECKAESLIRELASDQHVQFLRTGYFCIDEKDSTPEFPVFNRTIPLRDSWEKLKKKMGI
ncbi:MAG: glutamine--tRNA ligase/YqeY domain fusion protein [Spirochaetia bacterium]|nr:glutamine--tRNA ligase/YqeY domain fusion protein [Spirochaetia bacterium]